MTETQDQITEPETRQLATLRTIKALTPITFTGEDGQPQTADSIELATIDGWHCVVRKGEFEVGSPCVYIEIDSLIPNDKKWISFLVESPRKPVRIRTKRILGQISQGLALPFSAFAPGELPIGGEPQSDVTESLGITKYEPVQVNQFKDQGEAHGLFPEFLRKTDSERIQNCYDKLSKYLDRPWVATEKIDGQSATFYIKDGKFGICSRNIELKCQPGGRFYETAVQWRIEEKLRSIGGNIAIQGEQFGAGIQGNRYGTQLSLRVFDVFDINHQEYLYYSHMQRFCDRLGLLTVPCTTVFCDLTTRTVDQLVEMATRKSTVNRKTAAEGLVFRPEMEVHDPWFGRVQFKVINPEFLIETKS